MEARRTDGLLLLDKPTGPTSHDMVTAVRKGVGAARAGHCGTLDPLASGLLVILLGTATRLAPFVRGDPKIYEGSIVLGLTTDSMDIEGQVTSESDYTGGEAEVRDALASLEGELEQLPPMYSAVKYRGKPLHRYARKGEEVPRRARRVSVYSVEMLAFHRTGERMEVDFRVACSPGTYVRELAARLGEALGCGGALSRLRRTASGPFLLEHAHSLDELEKRGTAGDVILPASSALRGHMSIEVEEAVVEAVCNGSQLEGSMLRRVDEGIVDGDIVAVHGGGKLLGVHRVITASPFSSRAVRMLPGGNR
ncbi:MAG: tRNA pseudouridine(55) synthase TruB [Actinomycetota bacterium]